MATFTVTTTTDVVDANDGVTSLREAVILANGSAGADTIDFAKDLAGSTVELEGKLVLATDVTINGDTNQDGDADITLSGNINDDSMIDVQGSYVSLTSLTITGSVAGQANVTSGVGVIKNTGILTITYCNLENNFTLNTANSGSAGTIVNQGDLTVNQSVFENNHAVGFLGYSGNPRGGNAAAGILNLYSFGTSVILRLGDTLFSGGTAIGGSSTGVGDGGSAALGVLNFVIAGVSGTAENDSTDGRGSAGVGGSGGGDDGVLSLTNLNSGSGSGTINQVALGTMDADTFAGGDFHGLGGDDVIIGSNSTTISGGAGDDQLSGGLGVTASGGLGNDTLVCTFANDSTFSGGAGRDTINFSSDNLSGQTIDLSAASFGFFDSTFTGFENVIGSQGGETIIGSRFANVLNGFTGNDTINGGRGNDRLVGGTGLDTLTGGGGLDVLVLSQQAANADTITDFVSGVDSLEIAAAQFGGGLVAGSLAAGRFRANTTGLAGDLNDRFIYNTTNGQLFFDSNGSAAGGARLIATFTGTSTTPVASDFDIV